MHTARVSVLLGVALAACSGDGGSGSDTGPVLTTTAGTVSASASTTATASASGTDSSASGTSGGTNSGTAGSDSDSATSGNPKFDVGGGNDLPGGVTDGNMGCAKVDLIFVIDNSGSMSQEQANLIANFPTFSGEIQTQLADVDSYHVMVTSTDGYDDITSDTNINSDAPQCQVIGASITKSDAGQCSPYAEGHRYMTDMDDLDTKFACAGDLGTGGSIYEAVGDAMVAAVSDPLNGAGGCQEGFLRDDALLVIVILTDEDDQEHSMGGPTQWYDAIVAAKDGKPDNVVVLGMVWDDSNGNPNNCSYDGGDQEVGQTIIDFTNMFNNGVVGSVCAMDYGPYFIDAVSVIESACDDFEPPG